MDCVLDLVTFVEDEWHQRNITVAVFLDIRRAIDPVSHVRVLHGRLKLSERRDECYVASAFLQDRTMFEHTTDAKSQEHKLFHGVPQGNVPSPTYFNAIMA